MLVQNQAVEIARKSDVVVLTLGANWNSDGESGDRATLGFSPNQSMFSKAQSKKRNGLLT